MNELRINILLSMSSLRLSASAFILLVNKINAEALRQERRKSVLCTIDNHARVLIHLY